MNVYNLCYHAENVKGETETMDGGLKKLLKTVKSRKSVTLI